LKGGLVSLGLILFITCVVQAQQITVQGTVKDAETGKTLPGVNVLVMRTSVGAATGSNGKFKLTVPSTNDTLRVSFIGYQTKMVPINGRSVINIALKTTVFSGKQLVVIGYGEQQKQNVNGAVSTVSGKEIENIPETSVSQLLQGQAAGVSVVQNSGEPGGATSVHIRGTTSITGNNQPLYIVDGVPISGDANKTATSGGSIAFPGFSGNTDVVSPLSFLNPNNIKSITILKDASAEAIYGSRGANGVVIIKTKSGLAGHSTINYNGYIGFQEPMKLLPVMKLRQYARLENEIAKVHRVQPQQIFARPDVLGEGTNWQKAVLRRAGMQNHQLTFSGGGNNVNYYVSGGYLNQKGIAIGSKFQRYTVQTNINAHVTKWLQAGVKANASASNRNTPITGSTAGVVALALREPPSLAVYNPDGTFAGAPPNSPGGTFTQGNVNPVARALSIKRNLNEDKLIGSLYAQVNLTKGLSFKSSFGGTYTESKAQRFRPVFHWGRFSNTVSIANYRRETDTYWDFRNFFTYKHSFPAENQITWLVGQEAQKSTWLGLSAVGSGFVTDIHTLNLSQTAGQSNSGFKGVYTLASYFTRLIYSFRQKYSLTASFRADGSSKFAKGHQWGYFPAIAASWKIYKEPFMKEFNNYVNKLKIKAGYGITGNQDIGNFLFTSNLNAIATGIGTGFGVSNISNPNLKWELQKQLNLGISFGLLKDNLKVNVELYNKKSSRFLFQLPLPLYLTGNPDLGGIAPPFVNLGNMLNRGIGATISYQTNKKKNFSWSSKLTISHNHNKVLKLFNKGFNVIGSVENSTGTTNDVTKTVEGKPIGLFYGYKVKGIFNDKNTIRKQPKQFGRDFDPPSDTLGSATPLDSTWLGDIQYVDVNGDGVINSKDKTFIGNPHPEFTFGFHNTFNYKNIGLTVFLQGSVGNDILDVNRIGIISAWGPGINQLAAAANHWTPTNRNAKLPRLLPALDNPNNKISSRFVENGSYLRIKNIKLSYTLPVNLTQKIEITNLRIYASITNLHTFAAYSGYDPDVGAYNQSAILMGVDAGRYPEARTFTFGLNVSF
jgi:TonB-linked SusC/RagA family outer membrane protein